MGFLSSLNPLNQLGLVVLGVIVGLCVFVYVKYIKGGDPISPDDKDWKTTRDMEVEPKLAGIKAWLDETKDTYHELVHDLDKSIAKMFKQLVNDTIFQWGFVKEFFKAVGRAINWNKYKFVYIFIILVVCGLILHYVFGV